MNLKNSKPKLVPILELKYQCWSYEFRGTTQYCQLDDEYGIFYQSNCLNIVNQTGKTILQQPTQSKQYKLAYQNEFQYLAIYLYHQIEFSELKIFDLKTQKTILSKSIYTLFCHYVYGFSFNCETLIWIDDCRINFIDLDGQSRSQKMKVYHEDSNFTQAIIINSSFILFQYVTKKYEYNHFNYFTLIYMSNGKHFTQFKRKRQYYYMNLINQSIYALYYRSFELKEFHFQLINIQGKILRMIKKQFNEALKSVLKTSFINNEYYIFLKESYLKVNLIKGGANFFEFSFGNFITSSFSQSQPIFSNTVAEPMIFSEKINVKASICKFEV